MAEWDVIAEVVEDGFHRVSPLRVQRVLPNMKVVGKQMRFVSSAFSFPEFAHEALTIDLKGKGDKIEAGELDFHLVSS